MNLDAMMTNPPCTADEARAVVRLREVGVIPALMDWPESLKYAREHNMITPYLTTEAALTAQQTTREMTLQEYAIRRVKEMDADPMPNASILPGAVKGDGEWVVEELATLLNDLTPKLIHLAYRAELDGEDEAAELAGALLYTARVGCDNLEAIIEDGR